MSQLGPENLSTEMDDTTRTVVVSQKHWWRRLLAFVGPAYMISVGYMDPGNWATDLAGGAQFGYTLLWVLLMSNAMAVLLQTLSARLGLVTGRDLAQACRQEYPPLVRYSLFVLCEIAIAATDLAEVLGSAIGINLLFGIPLLWAVLITGCDTLLLLVIQHLGIRKMEAFIILLVATIGLCFVIEIFLVKPEAAAVARGLIPHVLTPGQLYVAIGIIGATVMPHNLYLHSALVQSRDVARRRSSVAEACRFNLVDSVVAMNGAFLVNAAILIVAAAAFHTRGQEVADLRDAHRLLENLLGSRIAPAAFAIALICAGQSSTITGTLAGQITMEGFLNIRLRPWLRRLITRMLAIVPAVIVISVMGEDSATELLIFSQVILSLQLPFAVIPLIKFTSSRRKMGPFASPAWVKVLAWLVGAVIVGLNVTLLAEQFGQWLAGAGAWAVPLGAGLGAICLALVALLGWMVLRREERIAAQPGATAQDVLTSAEGMSRRFERIGASLENLPSDDRILAEAIALARTHGAELVLLHVVEGVGGQWFGPQTGDLEARQDEVYLENLAAQVTARHQELPAVRYALGYGNVTKALVALAQKERLDLLVMGGHGHKRLADLLHGETITGVRHGTGISMLSVR